MSEKNEESDHAKSGKRGSLCLNGLEDRYNILVVSYLKGGAHEKQWVDRFLEHCADSD